MGVRPGSRTRNMQRGRASTSVSSWLNFTPLSLNPALWLDAADTATITASGGAVSQWNDKSGNGRNFAQATSANQPSTGVSTRNGLNVISFDGSQDSVDLGTNGLGRNVTGATIYVVYRHTSNPTTDKRIFLVNIGTSAGFSRIVVRDGLTSQRTNTGGRTLDADSFASVTGSAVIGTSYLYRTSVFDYANTDLFNYVNGVVDGSTTSFQTATTTSDTDSLSATVGSNSSILNFVGEIAEILMYHTAHTTAQQVTVETYLKAKWGL